ncbi:MAG: hypothetical protein AAFQ82_18520, partial [Myxococcota bacterium]
MKTWIAFVFALPLFAASTAHADPIDDVRTGRNVKFISARAHYDGDTFHAGAWEISKAPGSLDMVVPLSFVGVSHPGVVTLRGSRSGADLQWTFDTRLSPDLRSGDIRVKRVNGTIVARARYVPGSSSPTCSGVSCGANVVLTEARPTTIRVRGCAEWFLGCKNFDERVTVRSFRAYAGIPRPKLNRVAMWDGSKRCSNPAPTRLTGVVTLRSNAPAGGAYVDLRSTQRSKVRVSPVRVAAGRRSARFHVQLAGGWAGAAQIVASAGGAVDLALVEREDCKPDWLWEVLRELPLYADYGQYQTILPQGQVVLRGDELTLIVDSVNGKAFDLGALKDWGKATVVDVTANGELIGTVVRDNQSHAFRWNIQQDAEEPVFFEGFTPVAVNDHGLALARKDEGREWFYLDDFGPVEVPELQGLEVESAVAGRDRRFTVTVKEEDSHRILQLDSKEPKILAESAVALDVNASGAVLAQRDLGAGKTWPLLIDPELGEVELPIPEFCESVAAVALAEDYRVLLNGWCGGKSAPFWIDLDGNIQWLKEFLAADAEWSAVALSDDGQILLRARDSK